MKQKIYIIALLILFGIGALKVQAQYKAFRISLKATGQCLTNDNGILTLADKRNGSNGLSQLFTIKRVTDNKVWIASASDNSLYIKRTGSNVVLASHTGVGDLEFHWELNYAGGEFCNFAKGDATHLVMNVTGDNIGYAQPPELTNLDDTAADYFRFKLEEVIQIL